MSSKIVPVLSLSLTLTMGSALAVPMELITNGGFESGTLAGWTVTDLAGGSGSWFIDDADGVSPLSTLPITGPATGNFYATSDQTGPGTHALEQAFLVPVGATSVVVSFDMFRNDFSGSGPIVHPIGLDHNVPANQHGRVDILAASAGLFSTAAVDIVSVVVPPGIDGGAYIPYSLDITSLVTGGSSYRLRFAETDNLGFFHQGVDNVSVLADTVTTAVPTPATLLLALTGLACLRRKKNRT